MLDESTPRRLAFLFPESFEVSTVQQMGWVGTQNGILLQLASEHQFNALVTVDQGFEYQQNVNALPIPVVIMIAQTNRLQDLQPLVSDVVSILNSDPDFGFYRVQA